jgi:hypothetical protein
MMGDVASDGGGSHPRAEEHQHRDAEGRERTVEPPDRDDVAGGSENRQSGQREGRRHDAEPRRALPDRRDAQAETHADKRPDRERRAEDVRGGRFGDAHRHDGGALGRVGESDRLLGLVDPEARTREADEPRQARRAEGQRRRNALAETGETHEHSGRERTAEPRQKHEPEEDAHLLDEAGDVVRIAERERDADTAAEGEDDGKGRCDASERLARLRRRRLVDGRVANGH